MKLDLSTGCLVTVTQEELDRRISVVRKLLEELSAGLLLVACPMKGNYTTYLTGESGPGRPSEGAILVGRSGDVVSVNGGALVPRGGQGQRNFAMAKGMEGGAFAGYRSCEGFSADVIEELLGTHKRIAVVNMRFLRADVKEYLDTNLPDVELTDADREMWRLRAVKSAEELRIIEENCLQIDKIFLGAGIYLNPMKYERDVVKDLRYAAYRLGSGGVDDLISTPMELVSYRDGEEKETEKLYHPGRRITLGDAVNIRMYAAGNDGYFTGLSRTYVLGKISETTERLWEKAVELQDLAAAALKPGNTVKNAVETVNHALKEAGLQEDIGCMIHSIGVSREEAPGVYLEDEEILRENMVFYVGPSVSDGIHEPLSCGDLYLITQDGAKRLTDTPRKIFRLY